MSASNAWTGPTPTGARAPKLPNNVMVHEFLGLLGKPDAIVIFEAPDASTAADFMVQFSRVTDATTSLALPIEEFKWTW